MAGDRPPSSRARSAAQESSSARPRTSSCSRAVSRQCFDCAMAAQSAGSRWASSSGRSARSSSSVWASTASASARQADGERPPRRGSGGDGPLPGGGGDVAQHVVDPGAAGGPLAECVPDLVEGVGRHGAQQRRPHGVALDGVVVQQHLADELGVPGERRGALRLVVGGPGGQIGQQPQLAPDQPVHHALVGDGAAGRPVAQRRCRVGRPTSSPAARGAGIRAVGRTAVAAMRTPRSAVVPGHRRGLPGRMPAG